MLDDVLPTLYFAWFWVRLQVHMLWLRLNKWLYFAALSPAKNARYIAVVGDGVAEGVGDWITLGHNPGLAGHLQSLIRKRNPGQVRATAANGPRPRRPRSPRRTDPPLVVCAECGAQRGNILRVVPTLSQKGARRARGRSAARSLSQRS